MYTHNFTSPPKNRNPKILEINSRVDTCPTPQEDTEQAALERVNATLLEGHPARKVPLSAEELPLVTHLCLLTMKPVIYAANVAEGELADPLSNRHVAAVQKFASEQGAECVVVSAQVEAELSELSEGERGEYLESLGVKEGGLGGLVRATYHLLGLRTYFTCGEKVGRGWGGGRVGGRGRGGEGG